MKLGKLFVGAGLVAVMLLSGCATTPADPEDPWEGMNRAVFKLNDGLDKWVAKPVAKGYVAVTPGFVETGVDNFFDNLQGLSSSVNSALQGKWGQAGHDGARFMLNTVAGLGGLVDVAEEAGLEKDQMEDFGQTLRVWGVPKGPYLVLPILGPSTITDAVAKPVDWYLNPITYSDGSALTYGLTALDLVNTRANLLGADDLVSGDRYLFFREAYLQNREFLVKDGIVEDDFGGELEDFDDF